MEGKNGKKIMFLNFYRVCKKNSESVGCTIRTQQERDLDKFRKSQKDPREVILCDLEKEICKRHEQGYYVIVYGDINDEVRDSKRVDKFLENADLKNIMKMKHHDKELPTTYRRGKKCLDIMAMSASLDDKVVDKCGIIPFHHGMPLDHRAFYVDLNVERLFTNAYVSDGDSTFKRFTTNQTKKCDKYLYHLERYMEENRIFKKVNELENEMRNYIDNQEGCLEQMIETCKKLFEKTSQLMIASKRKVGQAHYKKGKESSPILTEAAQDVIECRNLLSKVIHDDDAEEIEIEKHKILLKEAKKEFKKIQQHSKEHRENFLNELSIKKAKAWKVTAQQAATFI